MLISTDLRDALQFIAEGVTELAGFELAAISVVEDGLLSTVAVVGDAGARAELLELHTPVDLLLTELRVAEQWGLLRFLPQEKASDQLDAWTWTPDLQPIDDADAWLPDDMLVALLRDSTGQVRGVLSLDLPRDGRRPGLKQRRIVDLYARQAERAVITALEHGELAVGMEREHGIAEYRRHLIDVLSHDLHGTVGAIANTVDVLRAGDLPANVASGLSLVERGTAMIRALLEDMRLLAQLESPGYAFTPATVDLSTLVVEVCALHEADAGKQGVRVQREVAAGLRVPGEATDLTRMVGNLLSNAIKYSDAGSLVTVRLYPAGSHVVLEVEDQGIGIATIDQLQMYDEFFRAGDARTRERPGLGLGLTIVQRVVDRHRGRIEVRSAPGTGC